MTASIFIKSYPPDYGWLSYALRSINKFCHGFSEIVVAIPEGSDLPLTQERVVKIPEPAEHNYLWQQCCKVSADKHCKGDMIVYFDSDAIFTKDVYAFDSIEGPSPFVTDGKPLWLMTPMAEVTAGDKNAHAHATSMRNFSGVEPEWEYMRRLAQMIPRWANAALREFCWDRHKTSFEAWAMAQPFRGVTEFNHFGQLLHAEYPNFFHFHDTRFGVPESFVNQRWSWGGLTNEIRQEIESILA